MDSRVSSSRKKADSPPQDPALRPPLYLRVDLYLCLACALLFILWPQLDLDISSRFYDPISGHFNPDDSPALEVIYRVFAKIHFLFLLLLIPLSIYFHRRYRGATTQADKHRKYLPSLLLSALLLGPGVLGNVVLKDNSIGRARPNEVVQFGGESTFTRAFEYSGACDHNCSFISGHAAIGFYLIGLGWIFRSATAYWLGFLAGGIVGVTRIIQGGHFLSDVVFAFWLIHFSYVWLGYKFKLAHPLGRQLRWEDFGKLGKRFSNPD
ncbi:phosphatase PAP2 family protein [Spongiibacter sp. KMU-158]|uniref:Phosphatase PAP2 family protein n=1 Tax=Spongiibacter pelagi TaxID=2760804 RepID=A0A927C2P3_9GAMM|nr:phosphatase PAP2 family protein [Spongiibacter pelagi]MBD2858536.1 phosphatase PAP2 family protein [Spongiibacter pelagi]